MRHLGNHGTGEFEGVEPQVLVLVATWSAEATIRLDQLALPRACLESRELLYLTGHRWEISDSRLYSLFEISFMLIDTRE